MLASKPLTVYRIEKPIQFFSIGVLTSEDTALQDSLDVCPSCPEEEKDVR